MTSSIHLDEATESVVEGLVKTGRYRSRSEVLREGVRLVDEREKRLQALDTALARGIADAEAGRVTSLDDVAGRLIRRYDVMGAGRGR